jgi:hypothetical protein
MSLRAMAAPTIWPAYATSFIRSIRRGRAGPHRYPGDARAVCRAVLDACWDGTYVNASAGHFRQFWTRDLGFSSAALVRLGYRERVVSSLAWALDAWSIRGRVTTTIFPGRRPADVYDMGVDSLPWLMAALRAAGAGDLVERHASWLAREVDRYAHSVFDPRTGLVRDDCRFSTHRDTVHRGSNCYANTMVAFLDHTLRETGWLRSPIPPGAADRLVDAFWRGDHFADRADGDALTGDANTWPFWTGVAPASLGLRSALAALDRAGLSDPLPLRYVAARDAASEDRAQRFFVPDYQGTAMWTSLGSIYLSLLRQADPGAAAPGIATYESLVERDGTFWEVLVAGQGPDGSAMIQPYRGTRGLFHADEAMLWSALFLDLLEGG